MAGELTLARRYAKALLEVSLANTQEVEKDLYGVADAWDASSELRTFLTSPSHGRADKTRALKALFGGKVQDVTLRFLEVLVDKGRFPVIREIAESYDEQNDAVAGVAKATVTSYLPLTDAERQGLLERLRRFTSRADVRLVEEVDPALLGGLVVKIGDAVLDGSIKGRLDKLSEHLWLPEREKAMRAATIAAEHMREEAGAEAG